MRQVALEVLVSSHEGVLEKEAISCSELLLVLLTLWLVQELLMLLQVLLGVDHMVQLLLHLLEEVLWQRWLLRVLGLLDLLHLNFYRPSLNGALNSRHGRSFRPEIDALHSQQLSPLDDPSCLGC